MKKKIELYTGFYREGAYPAEYLIWNLSNKGHFDDAEFRSIIEAFEGGRVDQAIWNMTMKIHLVDLQASLVKELTIHMDFEKANQISKMARGEKKASASCSLAQSSCKVADVNLTNPMLAGVLLLDAESVRLSSKSVA